MQELKVTDRLTNKKAYEICQQYGYEPTGYVLSNKVGEICTVNLSNVQWFRKERPFPPLEHPRLKELDAEKAFNEYADKFDTFGDEWQDKGADKFFEAGWNAALNYVLTKQKPKYYVHDHGEENGGEEFYEYPTGSTCEDCKPLYEFPPVLESDNPTEENTKKLIHAIKEALISISNVSVEEDRKITFRGDVYYYQTEQWCEYLIKKIKPLLENALAVNPKR